MNPGIVEDVVALAHDVPPRTPTHTLEAPRDVHVRRMPTDVVPVRRAGTAAPSETQQIDVQARAHDTADTLRARAPGG